MSSNFVLNFSGIASYPFRAPVRVPAMQAIESVSPGIRFAAFMRVSSKLFGE